MYSRISIPAVDADAVVMRQPVVVVFGRHHDADLDAAALRLDQRVARRRVGHEVRVGDEDRSPRADDRQVVHDADVRGADLRGAHDRLQGQRPGGLGQRIIERARDQLAGGLQPVLRETGLQRHDGRTLDADLQVAPLAGMPRLSAPVVGDAGASGKRDSSIDDHRFSMISMVESSDGRLENRVVPGQPALAVAQNLQNVSADRR